MPEACRNQSFTTLVDSDYFGKPHNENSTRLQKEADGFNKNLVRTVEYDFEKIHRRT